MLFQRDCIYLRYFPVDYVKLITIKKMTQSCIFLHASPQQQWQSTKLKYVLHKTMPAYWGETVNFFSHNQSYQTVIIASKPTEARTTFNN